MKIISKLNYSHILFEEDGRTYLNVLCGGAAMYDITIELSNKEAKECQISEDNLNELISKINSAPEVYKSRWETKKFNFPKA